VDVVLDGPQGATVTWNYGRGSARFPTKLNITSGFTATLDVTTIPERAGLTLHGTLHIAEVQPETREFLQHNAVPLSIAAEDIDQAASGNLVVKTVYLRRAEDDEAPIPQVETLVNTRLAYDVDPLAEARRRGHVLATLRLGNRTAADEVGVAAPTDSNPQPAEEADSAAARQPPAGGSILGTPATAYGALILHKPDEIQERLSELSKMVSHWREQIAAREKEVAAGRQEQKFVDNAKDEVRSWQNKLDLALAQREAQIKLLKSEWQAAEAAFVQADNDRKRVAELVKTNAISQAVADKRQLQFDEARRRLNAAMTLLELYSKIRYDGEASPAPEIVEPSATPAKTDDDASIDEPTGEP
jgi:hypothetical protein